MDKTIDFDERIIQKEHVEAAILRYRSSTLKHHPARSAFLYYDGHELPAKFIIRLAFEKATGHLPSPQTLTGGKASVRVLQGLGFDAQYKKETVIGGKRNKVKNERREAFRKILSEMWGEVELEKKLPGIMVPDLKDRSSMPSTLHNILKVIEAYRGIPVQGQKNYKLAFDFYIPKLKLAIEFDEKQHFTPLRAVALKAYPADINLGFDKQRWIALSEQIRAGDNSPIYRDEQRAFYDAIRDILALQKGLNPVIRIFENDVAWETEEGAQSSNAQFIIQTIKKFSI
jgi:very-short-patch-repair endonuclease